MSVFAMLDGKERGVIMLLAPHLVRMVALA